jgi:hypothetical protein
MRVLIACKHGEAKESCAKCAARRKYAAEWQRKNPDKVRAYSKKWAAGHPQERSAAVASWRDRNPEKVAGMSNRAGAKWSRENSGARNALTSFTRAKRLGGFVAWADRGQIRNIYMEAARLTRETGVAHEVDHVLPLRGELVSGLHVHQNLRITTQFENRSKGRRVEL